MAPLADSPGTRSFFWIDTTYRFAGYKYMMSANSSVQKQTKEIINMNIKGFSTNGIKLLHQTITKALAEDDARPNGAEVYGVREYPDWRREADQLEAELANRSETFAPIVW
jgi:hypothetical protein